eukprot:2726890-Pleurochrysis_carterae.AAC.1
MRPSRGELRTRRRYMRGDNFVFKSPVSRGADSRFAIEGKSKHVDMLTHNELARLSAVAEVG